MIVGRLIRRDIPPLYKLIVSKLPDKDTLTYSDLRKALSKMRFTREEMNEIIRELKILRLLEDKGRYVRLRRPIGSINIQPLTKIILWR